jgi:M6 family metalloprotease-like protein
MRKQSINTNPHLRSITWIIFAVYCTATQLHAVGAAVPVAKDSSIKTDKNMPVSIMLAGSDADNDPLSYTVVSNPSHGAMSGTAPNLTYKPTAGFHGTDSFTFKASDGKNESNIATVSITIHGVRVLNYKAATPGTTKTYKVAVLMINTLTKPQAENPATKQLEFCSPEKLGQIFFEHKHGAASYMKEASYGKVALEGSVVGWLDHPVAGLDGGKISTQADIFLSLANEYLTYSDYDVFVVYAQTETGGQQTGWLYPQQTFNTPQGKISNVGITWMVNSEIFDDAPLLTSNWSLGDAVLPTTSWSHEMLHTFGITGHSNSYDCGNETLTTTGTKNPINAYGGCFSIMGEHAFSTHPDALMKSRIGWLTPQQIPDIKTSGTYEIHPLAANDGGTKALVIPLRNPIIHNQHTSEFDALVVEYRTATGFDRYLQRLGGSPFLSSYSSLTDIDSNGVLVYMRYKNTDTDGTVLLDMNPTTAFNDKRGIKLPGNVGKFADAMLPINRTFTWDNIQITPLGTNSSGAMRVSVTVKH